MSEPSASEPERRVGDALRTAIERTFELAGRPAKAGSPSRTRERAAELLDEVVRRGRGARGEVARRGVEARGEVARRSRPAREELARRLELLEQRLATLEEALRRQSQSKPED